MKIFIYSIVLLLPLFVFTQTDSNNSIKNKYNPKKEISYPNFPKIKFNFSTKDSIIVPKKIKEGEFYQIVIDSINLNQYYVQIESTDTTYSSSLTFPTFGSLDLSSLASLVSNLSINNEVIKSNSKDVPEAEMANYNKTWGIILPGEKNTSTSNTKEDLRIRLQLQSNLVTLNNKVSVNLDTLEAIKFKIEDKSFKYTTYKILKHTNKNSKESEINIEDDIKLFDSLRVRLNKLKEAVNKETKSLQKLVDIGEAKVFLAKTDNIDVKSDLEKTQKALKETSKKTTQALGLISPDNIEKQLKSILNLYDENKYISLPIQYNSEVASMKIKFIPKDSTSTLQPYILPTIKFPKRKSYWSVGSAIYHANMDNERVGIESTQIDSTQTYSLLPEEPLKNEIGAALLLRGGYKFEIFEQLFGTHLSVSTGLSLGEAVKPRMLLGGGITIGQKHSFAIDFGAIGGYVNLVSKNTTFEKVYYSEPKVLLNDLQFKFFWSVGYAFRL